MADVFDRYHKANEIVEALPDGEDKDYLRGVARQRLHIEQARREAIVAYRRYSDKMNEWENNILKDIIRKAQEAQKGVSP